jgi:glycerol kinase
MSCLPEVRPSSGGFGTVAAGPFAGVPIGGVAGDQQSALFGQACLTAGMTKNTYGTGSFVLMNVGAEHPPPADGLLTSVGWVLADGRVAYVLEGAVFVTGAAVQWLRDGLGLIASASEIGPLAETVADSGGVAFVPAFTGLGSPRWDPYARGTVVGLARGSGRAQFARAVVEAMAFLTRDVTEAMARAAGRPVTALRADGGAAVMDLLLQLVADQLGVVVDRPSVQDTTALGAAYLAGTAAGVWGSTEDLWALDRSFTPSRDRADADAAYAQWQRAVERALGWARA